MICQGFFRYPQSPSDDSSNESLEAGVRETAIREEFVACARQTEGWIGFRHAHRVAPARPPHALERDWRVPWLTGRTIRRRSQTSFVAWASMPGRMCGSLAFAHPVGDLDQNPVPCGLSTRRSRDRGQRGVPLIRTPRTLPRVAEPAEVDALLGACRRWRVGAGNVVVVV
jgi:hypothetical protein